jgi:hypothetical protein
MSISPPSHLYTALLRHSDVEGTFLVREKDSSVGIFALSVIHHGVPTHHIIDVSISPFATFNGHPCHHCVTLEQVINYLKHPSDSWPIVLTIPVEDATHL